MTLNLKKNLQILHLQLEWVYTFSRSTRNSKPRNILQASFRQPWPSEVPFKIYHILVCQTYTLRWIFSNFDCGCAMERFYYGCITFYALILIFFPGWRHTKKDQNWQYIVATLRAAETSFTFLTIQRSNAGHTKAQQKPIFYAIYTF